MLRSFPRTSVAKFRLGRRFILDPATIVASSATKVVVSTAISSFCKSVLPVAAQKLRNWKSQELQLIGRHLLSMKPIDSSQFKSSRVICRSDEVYRKLGSMVEHRQFVLLDGVSGTGKTTTMQLFIKTPQGLDSPDAFPVACHIELRNLETSIDILAAVKKSLGLPETDSRIMSDYTDLLRSVFSRLREENPNMRPLVWIEDPHSCHTGGLGLLLGCLINSRIIDSFPVIMTVSEENIDFSKSLTKMSGVSARLEYYRFPPLSTSNIEATLAQTVEHERSVLYSWDAEHFVQPVIQTVKFAGISLDKFPAVRRLATFAQNDVRLLDAGIFVFEKEADQAIGDAKLNVWLDSTLDSHVNRIRQIFATKNSFELAILMKYVCEQLNASNNQPVWIDPRVPEIQYCQDTPALIQSLVDLNFLTRLHSSNATGDRGVAFKREITLHAWRIYREKWAGELEEAVDVARTFLQRQRKDTPDDFELRRKQVEADIEIKRAEAEMKHAESDSKRKQTDAEVEMRRKQTDAEVEMKRKQVEADIEMKRKQVEADIEIKRKQADMSILDVLKAWLIRMTQK